MPTDTPPARLVLPGDTERAASLLARAFADDPVLCWIYAGSDDRLRAMTGFFELAVETAVARGHAIRSAGWEAAALWAPPGASGVFDAERGARFGPMLVAEIGVERASTLGELSELMAAHHYVGDHFYLPFIGVDPDHQGRGRGLEVMRPMIETADRNDLPVYLESSNPRNISFYERLGFEVQAQWAPTGGPIMTGMLHRPGTRA